MFTANQQEISPSPNCQHHAATGPRVLFFSGGTALTEISHALLSYTHNSIHIISAFDSGGSSGPLRHYFDMPAVGDLRSRLIALTDTRRPECMAARDLLSYRLSYIGSDSLLMAELQQITTAKHSLLEGIVPTVAASIRKALKQFLAELPNDFQLRGASIGNLVLAGGYLQRDKPFEDVIADMREWLGVLGSVHLVINESYHLAATLANGKEILGQHLITGKEYEPINAKVQQLQLSSSARTLVSAKPSIANNIKELISSADLICYPPGSFYSSLIATLLPDGVADAISNSSASKVFVPNLGSDPEQFGLDMVSTLKTLLTYLGSVNTDVSKLLNCIIVDPRIGAQAISTLTSVLDPLAIQLLCLPEQRNYDDGYYDPDELAKALTLLSVS